MNAKSLGMKLKHMGTKWMSIDDQHSSLSSDYNTLITEIDQEIPDSPMPPQAYLLDTLTNVTFEISEGPEYQENQLQKLNLDEFPGIVHKRILKSQSPTVRLPKINHKKIYTSPWYIKPNHWDLVSKNLKQKPENIEHKLKNLYYNLHRDNEMPKYGQSVRPVNENRERLRKTIKSLDLTSKYKEYLEKNHLRLPSFLLKSN